MLEALIAYQVLSFASSSFFYFLYIMAAKYIYNLRITYPWMNINKNSRMFDGCLLLVTDLEISNKRLCAWTGCIRKDIGKASFLLVLVCFQKFYLFNIYIYIYIYNMNLFLFFKWLVMEFFFFFLRTNFSFKHKLFPVFFIYIGIYTTYG